MKEYRISASLNGQFLFRTDWDSDKERVKHAMAAMRTSMPLVVFVFHARETGFNESNYI